MQIFLVYEKLVIWEKILKEAQSEIRLYRYYTILYYTTLYYTILYYTILYYTILYYTILYYISHLICVWPSIACLHKIGALQNQNPCWRPYRLVMGLIYEHTTKSVMDLWYLWAARFMRRAHMRTQSFGLPHLTSPRLNFSWVESFILVADFCFQIYRWQLSLQLAQHKMT